MQRKAFREGSEVLLAKHLGGRQSPHLESIKSSLDLSGTEGDKQNCLCPLTPGRSAPPAPHPRLLPPPRTAAPEKSQPCSWPSLSGLSSRFSSGLKAPLQKRWGGAAGPGPGSAGVSGLFPLPTLGRSGHVGLLATHQKPRSHFQRNQRGENNGWELRWKHHISGTAPASPSDIPGREFMPGQVEPISVCK